jgi:DNA polymerase-4
MLSGQIATNRREAAVALRYLFVDMNSYFASVEQQDKPHLRGRPIAVVPVLADTTCCIAASVEAKAFGVKTGTPVWEAKKLCPGIHLEHGRHERYVEVHEKVVKAVGRCIPVTEVMSIDEMKCKLLGKEQHEEQAVAIARRVKAAIKEDAGEWMRCSVGIGPNATLAKVASKRVKPDGLTVLRDDGLAGELRKLELTDFPGIGPRMEKRFHKFGIFKVEQLLALTPPQLCTVWGSRVHGWRWWYVLRGYEVAGTPTVRRTVGHSHVLPPALRTDAGAKQVLVRLIHKAAARLRKMNYWAGAVSVAVSFVGEKRTIGWWGGGWSDWTRVPQCQDTLSVLYAAARLWERKPEGMPLKVGMVLADLKPAKAATRSLFDLDQRLTDLSYEMDRVNRAFGPNAVYFGGMFGNKDAAPMRIAFTHIPDAETESTNVPRRYGWG